MCDYLHAYARAGGIVCLYRRRARAPVEPSSARGAGPRGLARTNWGFAGYSIFFLFIDNFVLENTPNFELPPAS